MTDPREYKCPKDVFEKAFEAVVTEAFISELLSDEEFALVQDCCAEFDVSLVSFVKASLVTMATALAYPGDVDAINCLFDHKSDEEAQNAKY